MLRKSISLILAMMIVISVFTVIPMTASAEDVLDSGDYQYVVSDDHAEIVKYLKDEKDVTIPSQLGGKDVTKIRENAFSHKSVTTVVIPDTVTHIGNYAFYKCADLATVTSIGNRAFYNCDNLSGIVIPNSVESIGQYAFYSCDSLATLTLPKNENFTEIKDNTFKDCFALQTLDLPANVSKIGSYAFDKCTSLESVTFRDGLTEIGKYAFHKCPALESVTIPDGVTSIGYGAFWSCSALKRIIIPDSVTELGYSALRECGSLTTVELGAGITSIGNDMIASCPNLETVIFKADDVTVRQYAFNHSTDNVTFYGKHGAQNLRTALKNYYNRPYIGTDEHTGMTWSWTGYTAATLALSCDDCDLEAQALNADITDQVTKQPTCTEDGVRTYTATVTFNNKTYTDKKTEVIPQLWAGNNLSLKDDIGVNFYFSLTAAQAAVSTVDFEWTVEGKKKTAHVDMSKAELTAHGYKATCPVSASDMTAGITATLTVDGVQKGTIENFTVKQYANEILDNTETNAEYAAAAPLVKAMLNYGAYAQCYFGRNLNDLANADLPKGEQRLADVTAEMIAKPYDSTKTILPNGVSFALVSLSLRSETTLSLYFKSENQLTFSVEGKTVKREEVGSYQVARIRGITAAELNNDFTLTLSDRINGEGSVIYSPMTYCYNLIDRGTPNTDLKNVAAALYLYGRKAKTYFG